MGLADDLGRWLITLGIAILTTMIAALRKLTLADRQIKANTKALEKHRGKRKDAALDLGISERTLYRKIKEYGRDK